MTTWPTFPFNEVVKDVSGGNIKIPQREYLDGGAIPVVDQGRALVGGFTDNIESRCRVELPVVVFGDHTRSLKYVDFPFSMGADGVKVLRPVQGLDAAFLYRYLQFVDIPSSGYDRHFKYLKRISVPVPPISEQQRIVSILDHVDILRAKRREAIARLDELTQSIFIDMFGDPSSNPHGYDTAHVGEVCEIQGGLQVSSARKSNPIDIPYLRVANVLRGRLDLQEIKTLQVTERERGRTLLSPGDLLIVEGHGNRDEIGRVAIWDGSIPEVTHQNHLIRARCIDGVVDPSYLSFFLNSSSGRQFLLRSAKTTSGLNTISASQVRAVPVIVPPMSLQLRFRECVRFVEASAKKHRKQLIGFDKLFGSLQSRAFRGEL